MKMILTCLLALTLQGLVGQTISTSDLNKLDNTTWKGTLMYVNYRDGEKITLPTTMQIKLKGKKLIRSTQYPNEPSANGKSIIRISADGKYLGKEKVITKTFDNDGNLEVVTITEGEDNERPASITMTYHLTDSTFTITKKVSYKDAEEVLVRNKFSYSKL